MIYLILGYHLYILNKVQNAEERNKSTFIHLRNFNNWVKTCLIRRFCFLAGFSINDAHDGCLHVLDLCGGKFGDLAKWAMQSKLRRIDRVVIAGFFFINIFAEK